MPIYDLSAAAHAIELDLKQLDNLLSRNALGAVEKKRRGIARRLTPDVVVVVRLAKELAEAMGLSIGSLFPIAERIVGSGAEVLQLGPSVILTIDLISLRAETLERLDAAVELVGRRPRGRPRVRRDSSGAET